MENIIPIAIVAFIVLVIIAAAVKIVAEYERGVIFRLGRLIGAKGPGLFLIIPFVDRMVKVDLRIVTMDVPAQDVQFLAQRVALLDGCQAQPGCTAAIRACTGVRPQGERKYQHNRER